MKRLYPLFLAMTCTLPMQAQSNNFTLKQCIEYGYTNHPSIKVGEYDISFARNRVKEGVAQYLPQISGSFGLDNNLKLQASVLPAGIFGPDPVEVRFGTKYTSNAALQAEQKIFDYSLIAGYQGNKPSVRLSETQLDKTREDIAYNIASAYEQVLVNKEQIKLLKVSRDNFKRILDVGQLQYEKGVMKKTDLDRIRVNYNNIVSQMYVAESGYDVSLNALKVNMGMSASENISVADSVSFDYAGASDVQSTFDLNNRLDYRMLEQSIFLQNVQLKRNKAAYAPVISAYGRYGALAQRNEFGELWSNFSDFSSIGLRVQIPIFDGLYKDAKVKQQKFTMLKEKANLELYKLQFELQYRNARFQLERNRTSLQNDQENLQLAQDVFNQTTLLYEKGAASLTDLLNAETSYNQARTNYLNSVVNLKLAELDFERSKGTLLIFLSK